MYLRMLKAILAGAALLLATQASYALEVGDKAPDFSLPSTTSGNIRLADFAGKKSLVVFFYIGAFTKPWTQEALAFQLDLPKFEAVNAQVLGVSVDFLDANRAFGEKLGLTYPLASDMQRTMLRAYGALNDDPAMLNTPRITVYLRGKRAWFVIDKQGIIRYMKIEANDFVLPSEELIEVAKKYQ